VKALLGAGLLNRLAAPPAASQPAGKDLKGNSILGAIQGAGFKLQYVDKEDQARAQAADRDPSKVQKRTFEQEEGWAKWDQLDKAKK